MAAVTITVIKLPLLSMDKNLTISCKMCVLTSPLCRKMVSKLVDDGLSFCALLLLLLLLLVVVVLLVLVVVLMLLLVVLLDMNLLKGMVEDCAIG